MLSTFAYEAAGALGASGFPCALNLSSGDVLAKAQARSRREKANSYLMFEN
jgi:hypothetical protein